MTERRSPPDKTRPAAHAASKAREAREGDPQAPSRPRVYPDPVDDALDDSFPASDPPSWWGGGSADVE